MTAQQDAIIRIASLLSSRLCHDLVNPVGAMSTGLDVFTGGDDPELQKHAIELIKDSTAKSIAVLSLARMAFGSSGGIEGDLDMSEAKGAALSYYGFSKADLEWKIEAHAMPKARARCLLNLVLVVERSVPRPGSKVVITDADGGGLVAEGPKVKASDALLKALTGDDTDLDAKEAPAYLAAKLAEEFGSRLEAEYDGDSRFAIKIVPA